MKIKKIIVFLLAIVVTTFICASPVSAATQKNETVYAMLGHDGSVMQVYVVNQLLEDYTDYGEYTSIKNLSTLSEPVIDGDNITFPDSHVDGGLYYQGTMQSELPMTFDIRYKLNGEDISGEDLGGKSGHLQIEMDGAVNEQCPSDIREGLMAQITMTLNLDTAKNIAVYDATAVTVGNAMNISYAILPGKSGTMHVEADVNNFKMDSITVTLLKGTLSVAGIEDSIDDAESGFDDMLDGAEDMVEGTSDLKNGVTTLLDGIGDLSYGMSRLKNAGADLKNGMGEYKNGLNQYLNGAADLAASSTQIQTGLNTFAENGAGVAAGVSEASNGVSALASSSGDLQALAQSLLTSPDPSVQALAQGTLETLEAIGQLSDGLGQASDGVATYTAGVNQMAMDYDAFDQGVQTFADGATDIKSGFGEIRSGFSDYYSGVKSSAGGAYQLYVSVKGLPDNIQELIDGQIEFKDGIATAKEDIQAQTDFFIPDDSPSVSFTSDKNHPDSVQYILTTPEIIRPEQSEPEEAGASEENFFTRLAKLFGVE